MEGIPMAISETDAKDIKEILQSLATDPRVLRMDMVKQHRTTTTYQHVLNVAVTCYVLNKILHANSDVNDLLTGAILHDYFLYDWRNNDKGVTGFQHSYKHPSIALRNAEKDFEIDDKVKNIIESHMWPYTPFKIPKCREAWLVVLADKICAIEELMGSGQYQTIKLMDKKKEKLDFVEYMFSQGLAIQVADARV